MTVLVRLVWFHAPSVGEGLQARAILEVLRGRHPDWQIAFTHFSPSAEAAAARQPADVHAYLPADIPADVEAALDALSPNALVFVKLDVWPELAVARGGARCSGPAGSGDRESGEWANRMAGPCLHPRGI